MVISSKGRYALRVMVDLAEGAHPCDRAARCRTLPVWNRLGQLIGDYLDSVTLRDLLKTDE